MHKATYIFLQQFTCSMSHQCKLSPYDKRATVGLWMVIARFPGRDLDVDQTWSESMAEFLCREAGIALDGKEHANMKLMVAAAITTLDDVENRIQAQVMAMSFGLSSYA